jgi:hypothetical protein
MSDETQGEDALKGADLKSGDEPGTPVHSPTIPTTRAMLETVPGKATPGRRAARPAETTLMSSTSRRA